MTMKLSLMAKVVKERKMKFLTCFSLWRRSFDATQILSLYKIWRIMEFSSDFGMEVDGVGLFLVVWRL